MSPFIHFVLFFLADLLPTFCVYLFHSFSVLFTLLVSVFSLCSLLLARYGEIVDVNLVRDKGTGKSRGFAFLAYEDQRSTVLAVGMFSFLPSPLRQQFIRVGVPHTIP